MFKKGLLWVSVLLFTALICLYGFRNTLVAKVASPYLVDANLELTCIDWSLTGLRSIRVERVCIEHSAASIELIKADINPSNIVLAKLNIALKPAKETSAETPQFKPLNLVLPDERPLLNVKKISLSGAPLIEPVSMSLNEPSLNRFKINGDLIGQVNISKNKLTLNQVSLASNAIQAYKPEQVKLLEGSMNAAFDGQQLKFDGDIEVLAEHHLPECAVSANSFGNISGEVDLLNRAAVADLSQLTNTVKALACIEVLQTHLPQGIQAADLMAEQVTLQLPSVLSVRDNVLSTDQVILSNGALTQIQLDNVEAELLTLDFTSQFSLKHQTALIGTLQLDGPIGISGEAFQSQISVNLIQPNTPAFFIDNSPIEQANIKFDSRLDVKGRFGGGISFKASNQLELLKVEFIDVQGQAFKLPKLTLNLDVEGDLSEHINAIADGELSLVSFNHPLVQGRDLKAKWQSRLIDDAIQFDADWQLKGIKQADNQVQGIQQSLNLKGSIQDFMNTSVLAVTTHLDVIATPELLVEDMNITSQVNFSESIRFEHDIDVFDMNLSFRHELTNKAQPFQLVMIEQDLTGLQPVLEQIAPKLKIETGSTSVVASGDLVSQNVDFDVQFGASALFDMHYIRNASGQITGQVNSGVINIPKTTVTIDEFRSGAVLTNITAELQAQANKTWLSSITAEAFDGLLTANKVRLTQAPQRIEAKAENLDLAILAKAGREAGVTLTGRVSGELPIEVRDGKVSITEGKLYNLGMGMLSVSENASVNALKAQQPQLKTVIGLLDNLDIDTLHSDVALTEDGWLTLGVNIKGENKSQAQPVNFNYTHHENIYTLFKALRLNDEISQQVEKALTQ
ncbi:YdbH domain-containing protein [Pseudoalteromonas sp. BZB3]|uniref:YdbH domain-containing protein n=1 Tax=Pseudoalteromonas sp. BZB3 TaxID=3136670 RepID=UPI0032C4AF47